MFEEGLDFLAPVSLTPRTLPPLLFALATGRPARNALRGHDLDRIQVRCDRPLPLQADGEDLGDVQEALFEAERAIYRAGLTSERPAASNSPVRTTPTRTSTLTTTEGAVLGLLSVEGERSGYDLLKRARQRGAHLVAGEEPALRRPAAARAAGLATCAPSGRRAVPTSSCTG